MGLIFHKRSISAKKGVFSDVFALFWDMRWTLRGLSLMIKHNGSDECPHSHKLSRWVQLSIALTAVITLQLSWLATPHLISFSENNIQTNRLCVVKKSGEFDLTLKNNRKQIHYTVNNSNFNIMLYLNTNLSKLQQLSLYSKLIPFCNLMVHIYNGKLQNFLVILG